MPNTILRDSSVVSNTTTKSKVDSLEVWRQTPRFEEEIVDRTDEDFLVVVVVAVAVPLVAVEDYYHY
jgi:hypothetical protein